MIGTLEEVDFPNAMDDELISRILWCQHRVSLPVGFASRSIGSFFCSEPSGKNDPYFTMVKLFSGGGEFAKKHPDLLLLTDEDDNDTWSRRSFCGRQF